jgi:DNA-binding response OmpR family regulator
MLDAVRSHGRLLLVEDEALIRILATDYLEDAGFTVDTAGSATEAMNKLGLLRGSVDAVILDVGLPDRRGDAVVREIRAVYPSLAVVLATGQETFYLRAAFKDHQKIEYVTKPYTQSDLLAALRRIGIASKSSP